MKPKTLSAGVVVVRQMDKGCRYLLLRAFSYWDFPKGVVEPGEISLETACRELQEETGLAQLEFRWGEQFHETKPYGAGKVARYFVAHTMQHQVELAISPELGRPEHDESRWVSYEEGIDLLTDRVRSVLKWAHRVTGCGN